MVYTIYLLDDGTCQCEGKIQDGTERWTDISLESAIEHMKRFAERVNGTKIKKKDIKYYRKEFVYNYVEFKP